MEESESNFKTIKDTLLQNSNLDSSKFINIGCLGQGSFGSVCKAKYKGSQDSKYYAIKTLTIEKQSNLTQKDAECEVKMLEKISKMIKKPSAFPTFYGYTHSKSSECEEYKLYMDCKNHNLEEYCGKPIGFSCFKDLALQLINALAYLETYNMCHRDIKPKNILIEELGRNRLKATLIDFGVSKEFEDFQNFTELSMVVGTKSYLAPELLIALEKEKRKKKSKRIHVDSFKADVFSLGLVFIRVITGKYLKANADEHNFEDNCRTRIKNLLRKFKKILIVNKDDSDYEEKKFFCEQVKEMLNYDADERPSFIQLFFGFIDQTDMKKVRNHILVEEGKLFNIKLHDEKKEKKEEKKEEEEEEEPLTNYISKTYKFSGPKAPEIKLINNETFIYNQSRSIIPRRKPDYSDKFHSLIPRPSKNNERTYENKSNYYF